LGGDFDLVFLGLGGDFDLDLGFLGLGGDFDFDLGLG
jgi:hypothetical protein